MSLSQVTLNELQQLIAADAGLQSRLQGADDAAQAVEMIVVAAAAKGLQVEPSELSAHLAVAVEAASTTALSDAQLESVAGGMNHGEFVAMSVFTLMIGCAINSQVHGHIQGNPNKKNHCNNVA